VIYEPGKCINCGLCIEVAKASGEALGLTFVGRGFDVRLATPLDRPLSEALAKAAAKCAVACPTGALSLRQEIASAKMPIRVA
jgi:predicted molibdopterin-dependent oxidoreductase YjgC